MGIFDWKHWVVILIVAAVVFGTKRLRNVGSDLGGAIQGFRKSMAETETTPAAPEGQIVDQSIARTTASQNDPVRQQS
ncbi:twin-arginine translocase TatA/TatE family subunit [Pseudomonas matsuisoli]|uniref:Sec-independent protein translocase protein TatA n=1 Tax=Pseudomonas matsuisoli TaxID=1515666 RepID=A0A917V159_9PSED|nr:twin-arginine translocase TatA/TatE family subunit [Pseudomonas matsuisoli]GGK07258.1 Sec-independent protein translocase protein TatA [Pseudomonas matsuisoli]